MFRHYLKVFFRLFLKQTVFTLINIVGLAVGLACCLIIALYVRHELSFDRHFTNSEYLYRVHSVVSGPGGATRELGNTFFPVAPLLEANFPEIVDSARWDPHASTLTIGNENFVEMEFFMIDPTFFRLFDTVWLEGNIDSAYTGPADLVVTRSFAEKYFGDEAALGQNVQMAEGPLLRITGVIEDLPVNTHLSGTAFASMALRELAAGLAHDPVVIVADLTVPSAAAEVAARAREAFGGEPDIVVHAAGNFPMAPFESLSDDVIAESFAINSAAPLRLTREVLAGMRARGSGHVVTIGSVVDRATFPSNAVYAASKHAARAMHETLRAETKGSGVRATLISPAATDTTLWDAYAPDDSPTLPSRAEMLSAEDVAEAVLWAVTRPAPVTIEELRLARS